MTEIVLGLLMSLVILAIGIAGFDYVLSERKDNGKTDKRGNKEYNCTYKGRA